LDSVSVSPLSVNTSVEKPPTVSARRSPSQPTLVQPVVSVNTSSAASTKQTKQQLPLHLASALSKSGSMSGINPATGSEPPRLIPRTSSVNLPSPSPKSRSSSGLLSSQSQTSSGELMRNISVNQGFRGSITSRVPPAPTGLSSGVQQMLPLRLSEGLSGRTSSLPRGLASKSVTNMMSHAEQGPVSQTNGNQGLRGSRGGSHFLHHSKSSASILGGSDSQGNSNTSYLYGPSTADRMSNYYKDSHDPYRSQGNNGTAENFSGYTQLYTGVGQSGNPNVPIVHRRSGSSPVPMSSTAIQNQTRIPYNQINHLGDDDYDSSKVLFL
jgi:hypothetical protein